MQRRLCKMRKMRNPARRGPSRSLRAQPLPSQPLAAPWTLASLLVAAFAAGCSDDPEPTAPPPVVPVDADHPDRLVLIDFYNATGGAGWDDRGNWNGPSAIGTWHGVTTNGAGFVTELSLENNNLTGSLPAGLGNLAELRRLVLNGNSLSGRIPPELGNLANLTMLNLRGNALNGSIPSQLGALASVDTLDLFDNDLSGSVPPALGNLSSVRRFTVGWNELSGPIPAEIGQLDNATYMNFSLNQLTGTIPPELGDLESIQLLSVSRNNLTGTIPPELGDLATLERLYLYRNQLSGRIPAALGQLSRLDLLWIHENNLTGPIPETFADLTALEVLSAYENGLSGMIPSFLGDLPLTGLYLRDNTLSGGLPAEIGRIGTLEFLTLENNADLSGLVPRSLLDIEFLERLTFAGTGLCAQLDDEFQAWLQTVPRRSGEACDPADIERFALAEFHELTGGESWKDRSAWGSSAGVGDWYGVGTEDGSVVELALADNGLAGPFAPELGNLERLRVLDLSGNELSGAFPAAVAGLQALTELRVARNAGLEGALPFALRWMEDLRALDHDETGLCASPSPSFQEWYGAIEETAGAICDNPEQVTVSLGTVYLTQSVQTPRRSVRLVANRDAFLRAFVTAEEPRGFFEPEVVAVFTGPVGDEAHRVVMTRDANQIPAETDEGDLKLSYNAVIPAEVVVPGVRLVVEVDPEETLPLTPESRTRFPAEGSDSLHVVQVPPLRLTVVPVVEADQPDSSVVEWTRGINRDSPQLGLLRHSFPIGEFNVASHAVYVTSLDLTTESGQHGLLNELDALRTSEGGTGHYYGVAASVNGFVRGWGRLPGWIGMGQASPTTLTHEVGHNLSLRHAPCGGPENVDPAFPYRDGSVGVWGYDFRNGSTVSPERNKDIMTYCTSRPWLSDYYFEKVIDYRAGVAGDAARARAVAGTAHNSGDAARAHAATAHPPGDMLVLWGGVLRGELRLDPPFAMRTAARLPDEPGPYRILGTGSDGRSLFSLDFTPGEDGYGNGHFFFAVPIEPEWAGALERIVLVGPEGVVAIDGDDERALTVVTERGTGRIRAILRDWEAPLPAALGAQGAFDVTTTRTLREAVDSRR